MRPWSIEECKAYAQQLRDKNRACTAEHAAQAIEYLLGLVRREWVGLTLEEIGLLTTGDGWAHLETPALALFARAIEAKLKEKNG